MSIKRLVPIAPSTPDSRVAALVARVAALERALANSGIQFDTYPQDGGYLYVGVNDDASASPNGYGIDFTVESVYPDTSGGIRLFNSEDGYDSTYGILIQNEADNGTRIKDAGGGGIDIYNTSGSFYIHGDQGVKIHDDGSTFIEIDNDHDINIKIHSGRTLTVVDSSDANIFRIDEDGDLHGKTGKALTFDL